jgi:GH35 family endo-1,4-beta-xylanase
MNIRLICCAVLILAGSALADWKSDANDAIERLRQRDATITLTGADGKPIAGATIQITQTRQAFPFGSAISAAFLRNPQWQQAFKSHFNYAVFENETKWYSNERAPGRISYRDADALLAWCDANRIPARGHCIFWEANQGPPGWVKPLKGDDMRQAIERRINDAIPHFKGRFTQWDVNNEMLHGRLFADTLGDEIRPWMFKRTRELDPDVKLFVNDYNILSVDQSFKQTQTDAYVAQIQQLRAQGAPIDGVGIQGHLWNEDILAHPELIKQRLDKIATLKLPIWITEFDVADADEKTRADKLELIYRTAYSHPSVEGIIMWVFWAGNSWRGENAALMKRDWTPTAEGLRYEQLMKEWITNATAQTDAQGHASFRGFHGDYTATIQIPGREPIMQKFKIAPGSGAQTIVLTSTPPSM